MSQSISEERPVFDSEAVDWDSLSAPCYKCEQVDLKNPAPAAKWIATQSYHCRTGKIEICDSCRSRQWDCQFCHSHVKFIAFEKL